MKMRTLSIAVAGLMLASCSNLKDPTTAFSAVVASFGTAVSAEVVYLNSGKATPAIAAKLEQYRIATDKVLAPIEAQIAAGNPPSSDTVLAAQGVVSAFTAYESSQGISSTPATGK